MNRLILLGNGFDLAHKMETSYKDFLKWYLKRAHIIAQERLQYEDSLIKITPRFTSFQQWKSIKTPSDYVDANFDHIIKELLNHRYTQKPNIQYTSEFSGEIKLQFLRNLLTCYMDKGWVDIEDQYYQSLMILLNPSTNRESSLIHLNKSMKEITSLLDEYLQGLPPPDLIEKYQEIFDQDINWNEILSAHEIVNSQPLASMVLSFNYTPLVERYINLDPTKSATGVHELNYIHGKINDPSNPIIFGFGDELDSAYTNIEKEKIPGFLNHIKSFGYFRTSNYSNLIRFIDLDDFQVFTLGHSCGLSDRTLLNMIFEHSNCKSIKIFYHEKLDGVNNFTELTQEISRHFNNKSMMRRKIVPFDKSIFMPQGN